MSINFWQRKLAGCYVLHKDKYKLVDIVTTDKKFVQELLPEDSCKLARFITDTGEDMKWEDMSIVFPEEQYVRIDGRPIFGARVLKKAWRLGPSVETYKIQRGFGVGKWLNATLEDLQTDDPELIYDTQRKDPILLSKSLVIHPVSVRQLNVHLMNKDVGVIRRNKDSQVLKWRKKPLPPACSPFLSGIADKRMPIKWPNGFPAEKGNAVEWDPQQVVEELAHHWLVVGTPEEVDDWTIYIHQENFQAPEYMIMGLTGDQWEITKVDEIPEIAWSVTSDIKKIMKRTGMI
jgi:hypothetical protein